MVFLMSYHVINDLEARLSGARVLTYYIFGYARAAVFNCLLHFM